MEIETPECNRRIELMLHWVIIDEDTGDGYGTVTLPYEFLPIPEKGTKGVALGRDGHEVCEAEVVNVRSAKAFDHTNLLTMKVPKDMVMKARFFKAAI